MPVRLSFLRFSLLAILVLAPLPARAAESGFAPAPSLDPAFVARSEGQIRDGLALLDRECAGRSGDWWFGEAPGNSKACGLTPADQANCDTFYAADTNFWKDVWYWQTPETKCVDGRTNATCKGFDDWVKAWTEIKS